MKYYVGKFSMGEPLIETVRTIEIGEEPQWSSVLERYKKRGFDICPETNPRTIREFIISAIAKYGISVRFKVKGSMYNPETGKKEKFRYGPHRCFNILDSVSIITTLGDIINLQVCIKGEKKDRFVIVKNRRYAKHYKPKLIVPEIKVEEPEAKVLNMEPSDDKDPIEIKKEETQATEQELFTLDEKKERTIFSSFLNSLCEYIRDMNASLYTTKKVGEVSGVLAVWVSVRYKYNKNANIHKRKIGYYENLWGLYNKVSSLSEKYEIHDIHIRPMILNRYRDFYDYFVIEDKDLGVFLKMNEPHLRKMPVEVKVRRALEPLEEPVTNFITECKAEFNEDRKFIVEINTMDGNVTTFNYKDIDDLKVRMYHTCYKSSITEMTIYCSDDDGEAKLAFDENTVRSFFVKTAEYLTTK